MPAHTFAHAALPADTTASMPLARLLTLADLPELLHLEAEKWDEQQAATGDELARRLEWHPELCVGAMCGHSGRVLASLFMRPISPDFWKHARHWHDCVDGAIPLRTGALFGISLSSRNAAGVDAIFRFFWPRALVRGWKHIYLGSPIPGWREWQRRHPGRSIVEYVLSRRANGLPCDPQLAYYHRRGFKQMVCVKRGYFPHAASEDHAVILRGMVPLSGLAPVWRALPAGGVERLTRRLAFALAE